MLYSIIADDIPNSGDLRSATRARHLEYVGKLRLEGRLIIAGPNPAIDSPDPGPAGMSGSLIIAEFESLEAAVNWAHNDPYYTAGVFQQVTVKPFKQVHP